jgi:hypothetical protein
VSTPLAKLARTIPLSTVVTPAALTTRPMERVEDARNMTVPSLYFYDYGKFASVGTAIVSRVASAVSARWLTI